jgi:hypothetical protein
MPRFPLLVCLLLPLVAAPARAGSVTADSIEGHRGALQAAMQQLPRGATVIRNECQEIQVGSFNLPRYRCTVWFLDAPSPADQGSAVPSGSPLPPAPAVAPAP